jgi:hypothetical protein
MGNFSVVYPEKPVGLIVSISLYSIPVHYRLDSETGDVVNIYGTHSRSVVAALSAETR